ncbi:MAG: hypothetical protein IKR34_06550 [Candidatus Gastranaerophilales bacterium]|nr:hypothetical protein [Candidatus Gastranaerophilales bacterium]
MKISNFMHINQYTIETENKIYFQSYDSIIAKVENTENGKELTIGDHWNYSATTRKHLYAWLYEFFSGWQGKKKDVQKMLANKEWNGKKVNYIASHDFD